MGKGGGATFIYQSRMLVHTIIAIQQYISLFELSRKVDGKSKADARYHSDYRTLVFSVLSTLIHLLTTPAPSAPPPTQETTSQQPNPPPQ
jgi:hypothetical protein